MECCPNCGETLATRAQAKSYHYTESGLKNVFLLGMLSLHCSACEREFPEIENVPGLHAKIAEFLLRKPYILSGPEFRFLRKEMRKKAKDIALVLGVTPTTVSRWETGEENLGVANDRLIRSLYEMWLIEQGKVIDPATILSRVSSQFPTIKAKKKSIPIHIPMHPELTVAVG